MRLNRKPPVRLSSHEEDSGDSWTSGLGVVTMVSECPVCRHPINAFLFLLKLSSWSCPGYHPNTPTRNQRDLLAVYWRFAGI